MRGVFKEAELHLQQAIAALEHYVRDPPQRAKTRIQSPVRALAGLAFTSRMGAVENLRASRRVRELAEKTGELRSTIVR